MRLPSLLAVWRDLATHVSQIRMIVGVLDSQLVTLLHRVERLERPAPPPSAFVVVLVLAMREDGSETTLGDARELVVVGERHTFELSSHVPLKRARVLVFADLRRIHIQGIFCGPDLVTANIGPVPMAYVAELPVAVLLRVACQVRS